MTAEHYTTLFKKIEAVLESAGFTRAKNFKIRDDGMVFHDDGFNIVPAEIAPAQRQAELIQDFDLKVKMSLAFKFSPHNWYENNIDALADTESIIYNIEKLITDDELTAPESNIANIKCDNASFEQIEAGLLYIEIPITISYRHE